MCCLVYQSLASPYLHQGEIEALLEKSRTFNALHAITGCLLFTQGVFLQYLEGNQLHVLSLFDRIKEDKRHSQVRLLTHGNVEKREFRDWGMAYENLYGDNALINYLKLVVNTFLQEPDNKVSPNPTSLKFWENVSALLNNPNNDR
jgi:hypothetical protein